MGTLCRKGVSKEPNAIRNYPDIPVQGNIYVCCLCCVAACHLDSLVFNRDPGHVSQTRQGVHGRAKDKGLEGYDRDGSEVQRRDDQALEGGDRHVPGLRT